VDVRDPAALARSWHLLMKDAIVGAIEGDDNAARDTRALAGSLLDLHRRAR
jgi:hypothetical protein